MIALDRALDRQSARAAIRSRHRFAITALNVARRGPSQRVDIPTPMPSSPFAFRVTHTDGRARRGVMTTAHGEVETPAFMPVGTQGAVKGVTHRDLDALGAEILLSNTYHLYLRPGDDLIARRGGLHRFIGWTKPILTDSGGYQVFSLAARRTIDEEGARFRSHLDGSAHLLTPEKATDIQAQLGSDIAMVLDECLAHPATPTPARQSMERTLRWARRARRRAFWRSATAPRRRASSVTNPGQAQFGIVQGGVFPDLREESAARHGGDRLRGVRDRRTERRRAASTSCTTSWIARRRWLPGDRPRYLMGAGTPEDLVEAVARGVDLFDCVLPTRNARNGQLFTARGPHQYQERAVRRGRPAARSGVRLLHVPDLFAGVSAASVSGRRDQRGHP